MDWISQHVFFEQIQRRSATQCQIVFDRALCQRSGDHWSPLKNLAENVEATDDRRYGVIDYSGRERSLPAFLKIGVLSRIMSGVINLPELL